MPSANKMTTPVSVDLPVLQGRYAELDDLGRTTAVIEANLAVAGAS